MSAAYSHSFLSFVLAVSLVSACDSQRQDRTQAGALKSAGLPGTKSLLQLVNPNLAVYGYRGLRQSEFAPLGAVNLASVVTARSTDDMVDVVVLLGAASSRVKPESLSIRLAPEGMPQVVVQAAIVEQCSPSPIASPDATAKSAPMTIAILEGRFSMPSDLFARHPRTRVTILAGTVWLRSLPSDPPTEFTDNEQPFELHSDEIAWDGGSSGLHGDACLQAYVAKFIEKLKSGFSEQEKDAYSITIKDAAFVSLVHGVNSASSVISSPYVMNPPAMAR